MAVFRRVYVCPRPVTVVKDLPFGLIGTSYYPPFGTVTGWGQFPIYTYIHCIHRYLLHMISVHN